MIQIITRDNSDQHADLLDDMFRRRYHVLVELMGWKIPGVQQGYDVDAFDTDHSIYLIDTHPETGDVIASLRFNPTTQPHLMSEVFPHQCEISGVPRGENIWEATRLVYDAERMNGDLFKQTRGRFGVAITEFAVHSGITGLTWLVSKRLYQSLARYWRIRPLGLPLYYEDDGDEYIAAIATMDENALAGMRERRGDDTPVFPNGLPIQKTPTEHIVLLEAG